MVFMKRAIIICGPTAVGKSHVALEVAEKLNAEIISADSQQVWRGLDVGTAKPSLEERKKVAHHLIDVAGPGDKFDVSCYTALADRAIEETKKKYLFRLYKEKGLSEKNLDVIKIDYNVSQNPLWLRFIMDEIVGINEDQYLGKLHIRFPGGSFALGYFNLEKAK